MRFKKAIAAAVASCVMVTSAASLVKNVSAMSSERPAGSADVTVELVGVTDDYAKKIPLQTVLDNMTYAYDVFEETQPEEDGGESLRGGDPESTVESGADSLSADDTESAADSNAEGLPENAPADISENDAEGSAESKSAALESNTESESVSAPEGDNDAEESAPSDDPAVIVPETSALPEPIHKRGEKVEIAEDAELVWIDGEEYSITDKKAVVDLFVEDSGDAYIVKKFITIGNGKESDKGNASYNTEFRISKNRWTYDDFELYTTDIHGEKTLLKANLGEIRVNSALYLLADRLDGEKDVYLKLSPRLLQNGEPREDVDVAVSYRGENPKDGRILTDGQIVVDFRAIDKDGSIIAEQNDIVITAAREALRLEAALDPESEEPILLDEAYEIDAEGYDSADISAVFDMDPDDSEHIIKINSLRAEALAAELTEEEIIKAVSGRYATLDEVPQDAADVKSALFGDGISAASGAEFTLFVDPAAVCGLGTEDMTAFVIRIRFSFAEDVADPTDPETPNDPEDPDGTEPGTDDPVQDPETPGDPAPADDNVELYYDGNADRVYFDNISKGEFVLYITGSTEALSGFDAVLTDASLVTLGGFEVDGGSAKIVLNAEKGANDEPLYGAVSGTLTITADNAEPLVIELSGMSGFASITEHNIMSTSMKYVPYLAEYSLDRDYPWLGVSYSVIGELPEGLVLDEETGRLSGAPTSTGRYSFEIAANLTYNDVEDSPAGQITREVELAIANNSSRNLYMLTDPDYGFYMPLGVSIDGRAYYLDSRETDEELKVVLKGECSEFCDLWLDGVKLERKSDDYKMLSGATEITFDEGMFGGIAADEIHTLVFAYRPNSSDSLKFAAQNIIITNDKSEITPNWDSQNYLNMYTPVNRFPDDIDSDYAKALSSVRLYASSGELPAGAKILVRANTAESKGGIAMEIVLADEQGEGLALDGNVTAQMYLPESFGEDVYVYFLEDGEYREVSSTVMDGQVFFTLDSSKTVVVSQRTIDPDAASSGNPATGIALSSAGIVVSGAALVMILTSKRKKSE